MRRRRRSGARRLRRHCARGRAIALGLLHGPAELAPVSSSAHTTLVAWRRGWRLDELDPAARKRFELALHAGAAAAQLLGRRERGTVPRRVVALACVPPALAGALLRGPIERRLGTPATIAVALAAGGAAMAARRAHPRRAGRAATPASRTVWRSAAPRRSR